MRATARRKKTRRRRRSTRASTRIGTKIETRAKRRMEAPTRRIRKRCKLHQPTLHHSDVLNLPPVAFPRQRV
jgi:hypothetical protein